MLERICEVTWVHAAETHPARAFITASLVSISFPCASPFFPTRCVSVTHCCDTLVVILRKALADGAREDWVQCCTSANTHTHTHTDAHTRTHKHTRTFYTCFSLVFFKYSAVSLQHFDKNVCAMNKMVFLSPPPVLLKLLSNFLFIWRTSQHFPLFLLLSFLWLLYFLFGHRSFLCYTSFRMPASKSLVLEGTHQSWCDAWQS